VNLIIDMNLSPDWLPPLRAAGHQVQHWRDLGNPRATDQQIMAYAASRGSVVMTHDLDFPSILAATEAGSPSVILLRGEQPTPRRMSFAVLTALRSFEAELSAGALLVVDADRSRIRLLPLRRTLD